MTGFTKPDYDRVLKWPPLSEEQTARAAAIMKEDTDGQLRAIMNMEEEFARYMGTPHALSFNNGTAALFSAAYALGLPPGSEILVPAYTFWASVLPLVWAGLVPVFCDVDPANLCISPADMKKKHTSRTAAVLVVHLFGQPADMGAILSFAREKNLRVIEDASQALGASYEGKKLGTLGDAGCFSLQTSKHLPAGEGGLLVTGDRDMYDRAVCLGHYRRIPSLDNPDFTPLQRTGLGFKFRIHPVAAVTAAALLPGLDERLARVSGNMKLLASLLAEFPCFSFPPVVPGGVRAYWTRFHVTYDPGSMGGTTKVELIRALKEAGILVFDRVSKYRGGLHREPFFENPGAYVPLLSSLEADLGRYIRERSGELPVTEGLEQGDLLTFPVFLSADQGFIQRYAATIGKILESPGGGGSHD